MAQTNPPPASTDVTSLLVQAILSNPFGVAVVSIMVGLYVIGRFEKIIEPKETLTDDELKEMMAYIKHKKTSSPQTKELVSTLKHLAELLEQNEE